MLIIEHHQVHWTPQGSDVLSNIKTHGSVSCGPSSRRATPVSRHTVVCRAAQVAGAPHP